MIMYLNDLAKKTSASLSCTSTSANLMQSLSSAQQRIPIAHWISHWVLHRSTKRCRICSNPRIACNDWFGHGSTGSFKAAAISTIAAVTVDIAMAMDSPIAGLRHPCTAMAVARASSGGVRFSTHEYDKNPIWIFILDVAPNDTRCTTSNAKVEPGFSANLNMTRPSVPRALGVRTARNHAESG